MGCVVLVRRIRFRMRFHDTMRTIQWEVLSVVGQGLRWGEYIYYSQGLRWWISDTMRSIHLEHGVRVRVRVRARLGNLPSINRVRGVSGVCSSIAAIKERLGLV